MAISVLDVAVTFAVDKTATDAAFNQLPGQAQRSFGEAEAFAKQFNTVLDATAENISLAGQNLPSLGQAFRNLRITGPDNLKQGLDNAKLAFQSLQENGVTAVGTLIQAQIKVTEKQIAFNTAVGESAVALDAELVSLKAQYAALNGVAAANEKAAVSAKALTEANRIAAADAAAQAAAQERIAIASSEISAGTRLAAAEISPAWLRATEAALAYEAAQREVVAAGVLVAESAGADAKAISLLAAAEQKAALASAELAKAERATVAATVEQANANELLAGSFGGLVSAFGTLLAAGFFVHFLDGVAESIDEVDDLSHATGVAIPQLVGLKSAMEAAGDDSSKLGAQLSKVAAGLVQAASGSAEQRNVFKALGVQFDETTGKAPPLIDSLLQISDHLHATGASGDTLGLAYKALGKNSVELISFLGQGSAAIQQQVGQYKELGDEVEKSVEAGAEFQRLEAQISADLKSLTLPAFRLVVDMIRGTIAALISAKGELENFGRVVLLQGQVLFDLAKGLDDFNKSAIRLDFSGMGKAFKVTTDKIHSDWSIAMFDMGETTKKTVADAAKFLTNLPQGNKLKLETQIVPDENANRVTEEAKRILDAQLASIENWKAAMHAAFVSGQVDAADWAVAQVKAADAADLAQEQYLAHLITGFHASGEVQKEQAAIQDLATLKIKDAAKETEGLATAIQKHNEFALGMVKSWADLEAQNISKTWEDATRAAQELLQVENRLTEAQTRLSLASVSADNSERIRQVEELAAVGIISEEQKASRLREIYAQEGQDQLEALDVLARQQEDAVQVAQARLDQARDNPFFTDAQLLNLEKNLDKAVIDLTNTQEQIVSTQERNDNQIGQLDNQILRRATSSWNGYFATIIAGSLRSGQAIDALGSLVSKGIGESVAAAVSGASSFGEAMQQLLKGALSAIAGLAVAKAAEEIAWAFSDLASITFAWHAGTHFLAAAKWGAVGAFAAIAGAAVPSGRGNESQQSSPSNTAPAQTTTSQPNPTQNRNILRFATGALFSQPTMAILGDSRSGGRAREAAIPLDDPSAIEPIVEALSGGGRGTIIENHYHIKGGVIDTKGLMKIQSRAAKRGQGRLTSTDSLRVTRRG